MFHTVDRSQPTRRSEVEGARSRLTSLEYREAELVRRLVLLRERHASSPREVTERQVSELAAKLDDLRREIDALRLQLAPGLD